MHLVIITGLAGSGKSIALHTLEDLGYNCIDNLPVFLLQKLAYHIAATRDAGFARTAVGIDARDPNGLADLPQLVTELRQQNINCQIVFLDASVDTLSQRFSETRRKHPLANSERSLEEAMKLERELMQPIFCNTNLHVDTTHTTVHQLRDQIRQRFGGNRVTASILVTSFGYKRGIPRDADFVFDVRCLPNPYWQTKLRHYTGQDAEVIKFLETSSKVNSMLTDILQFLNTWIPEFEADGRSYLTIAIGCTGGRHRSVYITEMLKQNLSKPDRKLIVRHRELLT
jgi:UPF0042 nucleotide-binding protein